MTRITAALAALSLLGCADTLGRNAQPGADDDERSVRVQLAASAASAASGRGLEGGVRLALMTDKPLYRPGEQIRLRLDARHAGGRKGIESGLATVTLFDPRDQKAGERKSTITFGVAGAAFALRRNVAGGTYKIVARFGGAAVEREVTVGRYRPHKLKKTLDFSKQGYAPGDTVEAAVQFHRGTGEPLANSKLSAQLLYGDTAGDTVRAKTDAAGQATIRIALPARLDDRPTIAVTAFDNGTAEAIVRPVPTAAGKPNLTVFPEGGNLVASIPGRVFFRALDSFGDPVDVSGSVRDDRGRTVTTFDSVRDGYGQFELTPARKRTYTVVISKPQRVEQPLKTVDGGCALRPELQRDSDPQLRLRIHCTRARALKIQTDSRSRHQQSLGSIRVPARTPVTVAIENAAELEGLVSIQLRTDGHTIAQRTVFRRPREQLTVNVRPEKASVMPGSKLALHIETRDQRGRAIPASVGVAVVDDAVLAMADDRQPHLAAQILLSAINLERLTSPNELMTPDHAGALDALVAAERFAYVQSVPDFVQRISGVVVDQGGDPLAGVTVVATGPHMQQSRTAVSDGAGHYQLDRLPPGTFTIRLYYAEVVVDVRNVVVARGRDKRLRTRLKTGNSEVIVVKGTPTIDPTSTSHGITLDENYTRNIPVPGRTFEAALGAAAGTQNDGLGVSFSGSTSLENSYVVDGGNTTGLTFGTVGDQRSEPADAPHTRTRTRFVETVYWHPNVRTDRAGRATIDVELGDAITSYRAIAQGFSQTGAIGRGEGTFAAITPLSVETKIAKFAQVGDRLDHAVTVVNRSGQVVHAKLTVKARGVTAKLVHDSLVIAPGQRETVALATRATRPGLASIRIDVRGGGLSDSESRKIRIEPAGYPGRIGVAGVLRGKREIDLEVPTDAIPNATRAELVVMPSAISQMTEGTQKILREPSGCFEQTSSSNYPNVMALELLTSAGIRDPAFAARAHKMIARGYKRLVSFESASGGFEWFGGDPGHPALTAYGLLQFNDMKRVYPHVDDAMLERTASWLIGLRNGRGGFRHSGSGLDTIGSASRDTATGYIVWALAETGHGSRITRELRQLRRRTERSDDPYLIALAVASSVAADTDSDVVAELVGRLAAMQRPDGSFPGAKDSLTHSGGHSLLVESTALAAYALIRADQRPAAVKSLSWLHEKRRGAGWSTTQATILSLKAMALYGRADRSGSARVSINGGKSRRATWSAKDRGAVRLGRLGKLHSGTNTISLSSSGSAPFSLDIVYRTRSRPPSVNAPVAITTALSNRKPSVGDAVTLRVTASNLRKATVPMTLLRVGIPSGMRVEPVQLRALQDRKVVDFVETRPREVTIYYRSLAAGETKVADIHLVAEIAGAVSGPPSSVALYYTPEDEAWAIPLTATISRP